MGCFCQGEKDKDNEIRLDEKRDSIGCSLQCRRILGGRNLVRVRIVVATIFDFMTVEDWGEWKY